MLKIVIITLLISTIRSYIEIKVQRYQLQSTLKQRDLSCITTQIDQQIDKKQKTMQKSDKQDDSSQQQINDEDINTNHNYRQVCYQKDISYSLQIAYNQKSMLVSIDTTIPISWIKGQKCHLQGSHKKCKLARETIGSKVKNMLHKTNVKSQHSKDQYAIIEGSSQFVKGYEQKIQNFTFTIRDNSQLNKIFQLLMLGFYMRQEHEKYVLKQTNIINALEVSQNLNYLTDGAISFRFDEKSEQSFLKELFKYQDTNQQTISIFIDPNNKNSSLSIGQISTKFTKYGYGGIEWVTIQDDENYGKLPIITDFIIDAQNDDRYFQIKDRYYPAFLSLSASYIGLPKRLIQVWIDKLGKKLGCKVHEENKYMMCNKLKQKNLRSTLTFIIDQKRISISMQKLILKTQKNHTILNLKQTLHQNYTILGQPVFHEYLVIFDYKNNRVGFSQKSSDPFYQAINLIMLIRFVSWAFLCGCITILCYIPVEKCFRYISNRNYYASLAKDLRSPEGRRLKPQRSYQGRVQNPYQQLDSKIKQALEEDQIQ